MLILTWPLHRLYPYAAYSPPVRLTRPAPHFAPGQFISPHSFVQQRHLVGRPLMGLVVWEMMIPHYFITTVCLGPLGLVLNPLATKQFIEHNPIPNLRPTCRCKLHTYA